VAFSPVADRGNHGGFRGSAVVPSRAGEPRWRPAGRGLIRFGLLAVGLVIGMPCGARADGWLPTSWFTASAVDPQAMYPLAENDGPWLVLATTFRGQTAREDARGLVHELRSRNKLRAYTHEKAFDYRGEQRGMGLNPDGTPKRMRYAQAAEVLEVAVLVGDFASFEDPRGQKALQAVKQLRPETLGGAGAKSRLVADFLQANQQHARAAAAKPPMHAAMLIPNPLLPADYFARQEVDEFVLAMNADVAHSLLDCSGRYTVRVATFTGAGTFDTGTAGGGSSSGGLVDVNRFVAALKGSGWKDPQLKGLEPESRLVEAADNAHRLTEALRRAGWQAWEFHDRDSSIVCVGAVDQLAVPGAEGAPVPHPEIVRIVSALGPDHAALARGQVVPRSFGGVMLDLQPKPIDVPRRPAGR
jgi:hypothetical protein